MRNVCPLLFACALFVGALPAYAAVQTRDVDYAQGGTKLKGYLAWNDASKGKRPGVLVVHEWWGHNEHARRAARRLAEAGYVAFALDMYGEGKVTTHPAEAQAFAAEATKDLDVTAARFNAARAMLETDPHVDASRIGAIGYCFGGGVVLGMARFGADLKAIATFHGALATAQPAEPGKVKARLLVMTGTDDAFVDSAQVAAFEQEMTAAGTRFEVIRYQGVKHSFTNPDAGKAGMPQLAYDENAARKSWAAMLKFFKREL